MHGSEPVTQSSSCWIGIVVSSLCISLIEIWKRLHAVGREEKLHCLALYHKARACRSKDLNSSFDCGALTGALHAVELVVASDNGPNVMHSPGLPRHGSLRVGNLKIYNGLRYRSKLSGSVSVSVS